MDSEVNVSMITTGMCMYEYMHTCEKHLLDTPNISLAVSVKDRYL